AVKSAQPTILLAQQPPARHRARLNRGKPRTSMTGAHLSDWGASQFKSGDPHSKDISEQYFEGSSVPISGPSAPQQMPVHELSAKRWENSNRLDDRRGFYSVEMLLARITSPQSLISRLSNALAASGVSSSSGYRSMPPS